MAKVLVAPSHLRSLESDFFHELRRANYELVYPPRPAQMTEAELLERLPGCVASLAGSEPYTRAVFAAAPQLKVVARAGVGWDAVDVAAATEHGVVVTFAPGTNHEAVAEHTFMLMLAWAKRLVPHFNGIKAGAWPRQANLPLRGRTLGIVGLGRIGKAVAELGRAFHMEIIAHEPHPDLAFAARLGITLTSLEGVLRQADFISLHVPLTPESKHLIRSETLQLMKPTAFLVNTARGPLINETDLYEALVAKQIAGAALDVFAEEPPGAAHPLLTLENVIATPHTAGIDAGSRDAMALVAAKAITAILRGEWPSEWIVNPEVKERFQLPT